MKEILNLITFLNINYQFIIKLKNGKYIKYTK